MKKQLLIFGLVLITLQIYSQGGSDNWKTDGNTPQAGSFLGTVSNFPINFRVNNLQKMVLNPNGDLSLSSLAGTGNRVLMSDANGKLINLAIGNAGQYLQGDGTWGYLPSGATSWQLIGNNLISINTGNVGIGTSNPQYKLDLSGSARISGNLIVGGGIITTSVVNTSSQLNAGDVNAVNNLNVGGNSTLSGSLQITTMAAVDLREVNVTPAGFLVAGNKKIISACIPGAPTWYMGGNSVLALINQPNPQFPNPDIGTCDNADFILKSNNQPRQWLKPDGTIGFGTNIGSNTGGAEYRFNAGVIRLQSMNSFGGPQIVWDGGVNPYGDWGMEYLASNISSVPGLNFWKPFGSPFSANYLFFIGDDGKITVGNNTQANAARFNVDGWSNNSLKVLSANSTTAIEVYNKNTNRSEFNVMANGTVYSREIFVLTGPFPDYVFAPEHKLSSLEARKKYIFENKRMPNMPSAKEVAKNGANLGEIQKGTVENLEEAFLYIFQQEEKYDVLNGKFASLKEEVELLKKEILKSKKNDK